MQAPADVQAIKDAATATVGKVHAAKKMLDKKVTRLWPVSEPQAQATGQPAAFAVGNADKSSNADPNAQTQSKASVSNQIICE